MVIPLIATVAAALLAVATLFAADYQRTRATAVDAQLEQLVLAGGADACQRAQHAGDAWEAEAWTVALPAELAGDGARLTARGVREGNGMTVTIDARLGGRQLSQQMGLQWVSGGWQMTDARLGK